MAAVALQPFKDVQLYFFHKVSVKEVFRKKSDWLATLTTSDQEKLLQLTVSSETCLKYPVAKDYQRKFLKGWIQKLEATGTEIADQLYETYGKLVSSETSEEELSYKTFMLDSGLMLTLAESTVMLSHGTTGLQIWPAAYWLAEWVMQQKDIFRNKCVLELGCGVGFTGLVACITSEINQYVFTDWHHRVLQALHSNLRLNLQQRLSTNAVLCKRCAAKFENSEASETFCGMTSHTDKSNRICRISTHLDQHQVKSDNSCVIDGATFSLDCSRTKPQSISDDNETCEIYSGVTRQSLEVDSSTVDPSSRIGEVITGARHGHNDDGNESGPTTVHLASLDWEKREEDDTYCPDILLAADVVFEPKLLRPLAQTLKRYLRRSATSKAFVASSVRNPETYSRFLEEIDAAEITSEELAAPTSHLFFYDRSCPIKLLKLSSFPVEGLDIRLT